MPVEPSGFSPSGDVSILINPTYQQMLNFINRSREDHARILETPDGFFVWTGDAHHEEVADYYGYSDHEIKRKTISIDNLERKLENMK